MSEGPALDMLQRIYGNELRKVKVIFMSTGNSIGFELFQFTDPPVRKPDLGKWTLEEQYQRGGVFHMCFTVPDPDQKCEECCADGAARIGVTLPGFKGGSGLYFRDPWGNVLELMSGNWEESLANT